MFGQQYGNYPRQEVPGNNNYDGFAGLLSEFARDLGRKIGESIRDTASGCLRKPNSDGANFRADQLTYNYLFDYLQDMGKKVGGAVATGVFKYNVPDDGYKYKVLQYLVDELGRPIRQSMNEDGRGEKLYGRFIHALSADKALQDIFAQTNQFIINLDKTWQNSATRSEQPPTAFNAGQPADRPYGYGYPSADNTYGQGGNPYGNSGYPASGDSLDYNTLRSARPLS